MIRILIISLICCIGIGAIAQEAPKKDADKVIIKTQKKRGDIVNDSIYQNRILESELDGMYIPRDLYDAFAQLDKLMDEDAKKTFMAYADDEVDRKTHGSLGTWLEHKWSLSEGSRLSEYFRKMKVPHYDYMIGIIITSYHRHLHGKDLKVKEQVLFFRKIWNKKQKAKADALIQRGEIKTPAGG
ncbi:DUF6794 domain-containing protein [Aureispira anguillae]|uniref:GTP cyclohydrolase n=1 Tax=Aureispira anguillae TaxID=2864201 RepID=A0A916DRF4_9BACT|nr:DUF6794 domain-containing protein [Aureispira anguillae]BDS10181.1 GTP cyclohydrolase [Aureispira anguillae]